MRPNFLNGVALGAATSVVAIAATTAVAGSGVGAVFNLGQVNGVNATSDLAGSTSGAQFRVTNVASAPNVAMRGNSTNGQGVVGHHSSSTGTAAGVEGDTASSDLYAAGVLGKATTQSASGVLGQIGPVSQIAATLPAAGVRGDSSAAIGVLGASDQTVGVSGTSKNGAGVFGTSSHDDGVSAVGGKAGVHGRTTGQGSTDAAGVFGEGFIGVRGVSRTFQGVSGYSTHNAGVFGSTQDGFAGYFIGPTEQHGDLNVYDHRLKVDNGPVKIANGGVFHSGTSATLQAENEGTGGEAAWLRQGSASNSTAVLALIKQASGTGDYLDCYSQAAGFTHRCHIDANGTFVGNSDFAESLPAIGGKTRYSAGDVVVASVLRPGGVELSHRASDPTVIGVYSARPGVLGAAKDGGAYVARDEIPVAITGIVPVKASAENGAIRPGDLLTTARSAGRAMRAGPNPRTGTIVGKALGSLVRGRGLVKVLVMQR